MGFWIMNIWIKNLYLSGIQMVVWYSDHHLILVQYSNGVLNTRLTLVQYSNGIQITDHSTIWIQASQVFRSPPKLNAVNLMYPVTGSSLYFKWWNASSILIAGDKATDQGSTSRWRSSFRRDGTRLSSLTRNYLSPSGQTFPRIG